MEISFYRELFKTKIRGTWRLKFLLSTEDKTEKINPKPEYKVSLFVGH